MTDTTDYYLSFLPQMVCRTSTHSSYYDPRGAGAEQYDIKIMSVNYIILVAFLQLRFYDKL